MFGLYEAVTGYQTALANQCMKYIAAAVTLYTGLFDPRPDLAVPARAVQNPYAWWW